MTWQDIIRKLTSRKLWAAVALFVSGVITACGHKDEAQTVYGLIMQAAAVIAYIVGEGLVDRSHSNDPERTDPADNNENGL